MPGTIGACSASLAASTWRTSRRQPGPAEHDATREGVPEQPRAARSRRRPRDERRDLPSPRTCASTPGVDGERGPFRSGRPAAPALARVEDGGRGTGQARPAGQRGRIARGSGHRRRTRAGEPSRRRLVVVWVARKPRPPVPSLPRPSAPACRRTRTGPVRVAPARFANAAGWRRATRRSRSPPGPPAGEPAAGGPAPGPRAGCPPRPGRAGSRRDPRRARPRGRS